MNHDRSMQVLFTVDNDYQYPLSWIIDLMYIQSYSLINLRGCRRKLSGKNLTRSMPNDLIRLTSLEQL
uniref:Uncharacterized protein n=1 Tax=Helianthus annuus TaxID=4232 RepID=A0A251V6H2_HELAN